MPNFLIPIRERRITVMLIEADTPEEALRRYETAPPDEHEEVTRTFEVERLAEPVAAVKVNAEAWEMSNAYMPVPEPEPQPEPELKSYTATLAVTMRAYAKEVFEAVDDDAAMAYAKGLDFDDFHYKTEGEIDGDRVLMLSSNEEGDDFEVDEIAMEPEGTPYSWGSVFLVEALAKVPMPTDNPELVLWIAKAKALCTRVEDEVETPIATDTAPDGDDAMRNRIDRELTEGRD